MAAASIWIENCVDCARGHPEVQERIWLDLNRLYENISTSIDHLPQPLERTAAQLDRAVHQQLVSQEIECLRATIQCTAFSLSAVRRSIEILTIDIEQKSCELTCPTQRITQLFDRTLIGMHVLQSNYERLCTAHGVDISQPMFIRRFEELPAYQGYAHTSRLFANSDTSEASQDESSAGGVQEEGWMSAVTLLEKAARLLPAADRAAAELAEALEGPSGEDLSELIASNERLTQKKARMMESLLHTMTGAEPVPIAHRLYHHLYFLQRKETGAVVDPNHHDWGHHAFNSASIQGLDDGKLEEQRARVISRVSLEILFAACEQTVREDDGSEVAPPDYQIELAMRGLDERDQLSPEILNPILTQFSSADPESLEGREQRARLFQQLASQHKERWGV